MRCPVNRRGASLGVLPGLYSQQRGTQVQKPETSKSSVNTRKRRKTACWLRYGQLAEALVAEIIDMGAVETGKAGSSCRVL